MVKRYDPEIENRGYLADHVTMEEYHKGDYVRHIDYELLQSRVAELENLATVLCQAIGKVESDSRLQVTSEKVLTQCGVWEASENLWNYMAASERGESDGDKTTTA